MHSSKYLLTREAIKGVAASNATVIFETLTLKRYDRFFPKLPLRVTQQKGNKDIKSLNAHNSVTIGPTELADPSLESSFHALSDGQCVVSG